MVLDDSEQCSLSDILLKNARVIDPSQGIDGLRDIAIKDGKIEAVGKHIAPETARAIYPMDGKIATPGLIDAHCHPALDFTGHAVHPDEAGVNAGVLLVNDAGSAGAANFHTLRAMYQDRVHTEMTYFINLAFAGQIHFPEIMSAHDVDIPLLKRVVAENPHHIKGLKLRLFDPLLKITPDMVNLALQTADDLDLPLMIHVGAFRPREQNDPLDHFGRRVLEQLRPGDIVSHYMTWRPGGFVLPSGEIFPELIRAKERGVLFDCSHGKNNFSIKVAELLVKNQLAPDIISTDLSSIGLAYVQSLLVTMSKFLLLGMPLYDVVAATTQNPARALRIDGEWGSLQPGRTANLSILELVEGSFSFYDGTAGNVRQGKALLEPRMVIRNGKMLPCRSFYHLPTEAQY